MKVITFFIVSFYYMNFARKRKLTSEKKFESKGENNSFR